MTHVTIIGGGPGGYEAALVASRLGADVTLVERDGVGGSTVLTDCVPSKTLIATSDLLTDVSAAAELGIEVPKAVRADLAAVDTRVLALAQAQSADIAKRLVSSGVKVISGRATIESPRSSGSTDPTVISPSRPMRSCWPPVRTRGSVPTRNPMASASSPGSRSMPSRSCLST